MNKDLIEKIIKEKFSFETDYGIKTHVEEVVVDDDMSFDEMISIGVKFQRLTFIDVEKINELSESLLSIRTQVCASQDGYVWATFWIHPENNKGD